MESVGTKNYRQGFEAPAPHVIIVCPSCKTSFAVETAAVAALETPRFHCSRCDDIFVLKDSQSDLVPTSGLQVQSLTKSRSPISGATRTINAQSKIPLADSLIKPSDFSLSSAATPDVHFIEQNPAPPVEPQQQPRSELSLLSKGWVEPSEVSTKAEEAIETAPVGKFSITPPEEPVASNREPLPARRFVLSDETPLSGQLDLSNHPASESFRERPLPQTKQPATEIYRPIPPGRPVNTAKDSDPTHRRFSQRTQSLIFMSAPIVLSLGLLLIISYCARFSPQSIDALANYSMPTFVVESVQQLPPSSLGIKDLRISLKRTRNKESVIVVSGTVVNETGRKFEGIELEALGFNERGEIVLSSRSSLRSPLSDARISELSLDVIRKQQSTSPSNISPIAPREAVPFSIALLNDRRLLSDSGVKEAEPDISRVRYFSARIFSITHTK